MVVAMMMKAYKPAQDDHSDVTITEWRASAYIVCTNEKGVRRFLKRQTLVNMLAQIEEGVPFKIKTLQMSDDIGSNEYYLARSWMLANKLAYVDGHKLVVPSIEAVRRQWMIQLTEEGRL